MHTYNDTYAIALIDGTCIPLHASKVVNFQKLYEDSAIKSISIGDEIILKHQITRILPMQKYYNVLRAQMLLKQMVPCKKCLLPKVPNEPCYCSIEKEHVETIAQRVTNNNVSAGFESINDITKRLTSAS